MQYAQASPKMPSRVHDGFVKEMKYPVFTRLMAIKVRSKILGQPLGMLLYNSGFYILFTNIQILFFPKKGLYPGGLCPRGLITGKIYIF